MRKAWLGVVLLGWLAACSEMSPPAEPTPLGTHPADTRERVVHVTTTMRVANASDALASVRELVAARDGWVESGSDQGARACAELRVPASQLGAVRAEIAALGEVESDGEESIDVTAAHADTSARLRNARREEERLLAIVGERTATLADVLAVEHEIARVRESIELLEAEERSISDRVAMARISLDLREPDFAFWQAPGETIADAALAGAGLAAALGVGVAATAAVFLPSIALVACAFWVARQLWLLGLWIAARRRA